MEDNLVQVIAGQISDICKVSQLHAEEVAHKLIADGMTDLSMLHVVEVQDLIEAGLGKFQAKAIQQFWIKKGSSSSGSSRSQAGINSVTDLHASVEVPCTTPLPEFNINSPELFNVRNAVLKKVRPSPEERLQLVRNIIKTCQETVPNFERRMIRTVAAQIVATFPDSFRDEIEDPKYADGEGSLAWQLTVRYDNVRRSKTYTQKENVAPNCREAYGCINWQPAMPTEQDEVNIMLEKKAQLVATFKNVLRTQWNWKELQTLMEETYPAQRKDINSQIQPKSQDEAVIAGWKANYIDTKQIFKSWPFLSQPKGMNLHFMLLTNIDMLKAMKQWLRDDSAMLSEFMCQKNEVCKKIGRIMNVAAENHTCAEPDFLALFLQIVRFFEDHISSFMIKIESTIEMEDIVHSIEVPTTPCLLLATENMKWSKYKTLYLSVDGDPVSTLPSLWSGIATLFSSFFVLNIQYPHGLEKTYELLQRLVAKINPAQGSRCSKEAKASKIKKSVTKFVNDYKQFKQSEENVPSDPDNL